MSTDFTLEQKSAVVRIMELKSEDYYGILLVERSSTSGEIKRAYKKQALTLHPDKNKAPNADEAFKRVAKAFQVLSDETKRKIFDQTGSDPDSRGGMGAGPSGFGGAGGPFGPRSRFSQAPADDIFSQFFGGPAAGGAPFQFQFGGDPNDIFGQLFGDALFGGRRGGATFRTRPQQQPRQNAQEERRGISNYINLIIIAAVLILPQLFSWLFDSSSSTFVPRFRFEERAPYVEERLTPKYSVPYYVNPRDLQGLSDSKLKNLDRVAENHFVSATRSACTQEYLRQQQQMQDAVGWLFTDEARYEEAKNTPLPHCDLLYSLGIKLRQ